MAKSEIDEVTQKALEQGGILAKLYFDMQGKAAEDLQPLMADLINNRLLKTPGVIYCFGAIDEPIKMGNEFSTSATITTLFRDLAAMVNVAFLFTPAGVEVLKPERQYILRQGDLQALALNVAQISIEYSNYILSRVLSKEDFEKVKEELGRRQDLGKKILESKKQQPKK